MNNKTIFEAVFAAAGGAAGFLFGAADGLFYALTAFAVLDYVTGVISAAVMRKLSSREGLDGIFKKILLFVMVAVANIADVQVLGDSHGVLKSAVVSFLLANEGLSILENISSAGLPVPAKLKNLLKQLKNDDYNENISISKNYESEDKKNEFDG